MWLPFLRRRCQPPVARSGLPGNSKSRPAQEGTCSRDLAGDISSAAPGSAAWSVEAGHTSLRLPADGADPQSLRTAFAHIEDQLKAPDVLVYNAAAYAEGLPSTVDAEVLLAALRVNLIGAIVSAQWAIPAMRAAGRGTILFTGGGLAINPQPEYVALSVGKAALRNYVYSLAKEVTTEGIKVGTVTVAGYIHKEDGFDPDDIAEKYWQLHTAAPSITDCEIIYKGA